MPKFVPSVWKPARKTNALSSVDHANLQEESSGMAKAVERISVGLNRARDTRIDRKGASQKVRGPYGRGGRGNTGILWSALGYPDLVS
jgi:hypothetical protein